MLKNSEKSDESSKDNFSEEELEGYIKRIKDGEIQIEYSPQDAGDTKDLSPEELAELDRHFERQRDILDHKYEYIKEKVTKQQEAILDAIEKAGIILVPVGFGLNGDYTQAAVDCIVVKKLTRQLIDSGPSTFPLAAKDNAAPGSIHAPPKLYDDAVAKGFVLGKILGKKLQIRGEEIFTKYIRKRSGKIERRLLSDIGVGSETIFNKTRNEKYNKARLHISVDASGSMQSESKWCPTMTCVVAICVAASMVENLEVSVSFRSTISTSSKGLHGREFAIHAEVPYIVLAYDSKTDKISKIRQLFPYLCAKGSTPEGLAFESIAEEFIIGKKTTEQDHYFLNISDGEPYYIINPQTNRYRVGFNYTGEMGALHTKSQVDKIRSHGVKVLSYFIQAEDYMPAIFTGLSFDDTANRKKQLTLKELFDMMYGKDAQFIDIENVMEIARSDKRVGNQVLAPGWTDYRERVVYQTFDATGQVLNGENSIGALLAPGWYETPLEWLQQPQQLRRDATCVARAVAHRAHSTAAWSGDDGRELARGAVDDRILGALRRRDAGCAAGAAGMEER